MVPKTREDVLALCQQIDPNGCYTDDLGAVEGFDPVSHHEALELLLDLHSYDNTGDSPEAASKRQAIVGRLEGLE